MARILLVDDEELVVSSVRHSLRDEGHEVFTASHGLEALGVARRHPPELVILDINMPGMDGLEVCERLRQDPTLASAPILFLTQRSAVQDRVEGLDAGGDDYLPKPFDIDELEARVRTLLRRLHPNSEGSRWPEGQESLLVGSLALDLLSREACVNGHTVRLTPMEFDLLHYLMSHPGEIFPAEHLLQQVWGYPIGIGDPSLVRWHVRNLRAKIEPDPDQPSHIHTVPHQGYQLRPST